MDKVFSNKEIACTDCLTHKKYTYGLVDCKRNYGVEKCKRCKEFSCDKIKDMLKRSREYQEKSKEECLEKEYIALKKAFFG